MNKNILITGANGQLGKALQTVNSELSGNTFYYTDIDTLDILNKQQITDFVCDNNIEYVVNCAAYTAVDKAEGDNIAAMRLNCEAVRNISETASECHAKVIHISTDYVFDGTGVKPYKEDDPLNPASVYGTSKMAGEKVLQQILPESVIIRTAWLYSEYGTNFVKTMLRLGTERSEINVVADQIGTPTYAGDLASAITNILNYPVFMPGIYHYSNEGVCSWYDFAVRIMELAGLKCIVNPIPATQYQTPAKRPAYSVLDKTKIKHVYGIHIPDWETSLEKCILRLKKEFN